jgi:hypothetical protein
LQLEKESGNNDTTVHPGHMASNRGTKHGGVIKTAKQPSKTCTLRFESVGVDSLFSVLDAIAWLGNPTQKAVTQFTGIDPRTVGKVLKNCLTIGLAEIIGDSFSLRLPYPYKGSIEQKQAVVKESLFKMPLVVHVRQFLNLGDDRAIATRKAATMIGVTNYDEGAVAPVLKWAAQLNALDPRATLEDLVDEAVEKKEQRHVADRRKVVAFLSHSSRDKPFIRQLASDLAKEGIDTWLDEHRILVGDSITEKIGQGLAQSDFFVVALSENSVGSAWVQKELSGALLREVERRKVTVLPIKLSECNVPEMLKDKKYADFSRSYKEGLQDLVKTMKANTQ